ncbi:FAD/NAD(P)-binding domain-containing protein [Dentipellis sp. KUC8613]|nr:FAD/NAD(P)-binding domain-containing protein [Dentipellis sp. KUC8613]
MSAPRLKVAICGGGISGLCLGVALSRYPDVEVNIYEAAQRFYEIGAGVMIWSRTWRILELLGIADEFAEIAHAPPDGSLGVGFDYRKSDAPDGFRFHLFQLPYGCIRFHRAHFLDAFIHHPPPGVAHFGKRLSSYAEGDSAGPVQLYFDDKTGATCDILVGCDGIKSTIRKCLLQDLAARGQPELLDCIEPIWTGTVAYRGLIPVEQLRSAEKVHRAVDTPMMYCGKNKHVVSYSISQGSIVNVIAFASDVKKEATPYTDPWVAPCSQEELLACYADWEPEVVEMLQRIKSPTKWGLHALKPLSTWVSRKVALVGDAAHAMLPHQGAGAGQAIEDAFILASLLGDPSVTPLTLEHALQAYEHVRLPLANHVLTGSRESGQMYEFVGKYGFVACDQLGPTIERQWDWVSQDGPDADAKRALLWMGDKMNAEK